MKKYYLILEIPQDASDTEVRSAYLKKAKELHPDTSSNKSQEEAENDFKDLQEAYGKILEHRKYLQKVNKESETMKNKFESDHNPTPRSILEELLSKIKTGIFKQHYQFDSSTGHMYPKDTKNRINRPTSTNRSCRHNADKYNVCLQCLK